MIRIFSHRAERRRRRRRRRAETNKDTGNSEGPHAAGREGTEYADDRESVLDTG